MWCAPSASFPYEFEGTLCDGASVGMNTELGIGVYLSKVGLSLVIVFDICEVVTEGNAPKGENVLFLYLNRFDYPSTSKKSTSITSFVYCYIGGIADLFRS